ncbi:MAG TPA: DUF3616 domain-containing protein [Beijerinckiaceae bacterium]
MNIPASNAVRISIGEFIVRGTITGGLLMALVLVGPVALAGSLQPSTTYEGMCDGSAATPIGPDLFAVANDEDAKLRVYRRGVSTPQGIIDPEAGPEPRTVVDLDKFLEVDGGEPDIEGAALLKGVTYWITSHGTKKDKKTNQPVAQPDRRRFFALEFKSNGSTVTVDRVGKPYANLVEDLAQAEKLKKYKLGEAARRLPEVRDGLNIEGLAATPEGHLLIGFRNPGIGDGTTKKALVVRLENPEEVVRNSAKPRIGEASELDLGGLGIRDIEYMETRKSYLVIGGPGDDADEPFTLFEWSGLDQDKPTSLADVKDAHAETVIALPGSQEALVLIDDGDREGLDPAHKKRECKKVDEALRRFRSFTLKF